MKIDRSYSAARVRAAAHPLRLRMMEVLREGPATASQLARRLGESSGATSYHLRVLAKHGIVEEDASRKHGRERWWRRIEETMTITPAAPAPDPEYDAALAQLREVFLQRDEQALDAFLAEADDEARDEAAFIGGWTVYATPEEMEELTRSVVNRLDVLRRAPEDRPEGALRFYVTWRALPQADD